MDGLAVGRVHVDAGVVAPGLLAESAGDVARDGTGLTGASGAPSAAAPAQRGGDAVGGRLQRGELGLVLGLRALYLGQRGVDRGGLLRRLRLGRHQLVAGRRDLVSGLIRGHGLELLLEIRAQRAGAGDEVLALAGDLVQVLVLGDEVGGFRGQDRLILVAGANRAVEVGR